MAGTSNASATKHCTADPVQQASAACVDGFSPLQLLVPVLVTCLPCTGCSYANSYVSDYKIKQGSTVILKVRVPRHTHPCTLQPARAGQAVARLSRASACGRDTFKHVLVVRWRALASAGERW